MSSSRRSSRRLSSLALAGLIAGGAVLWVATGQISGNGGNGAARPSAGPAAPEREPTLVRVRTITAEERRADLVLRGQTQAVRKVNVKSETSGVVAAVPVEKGQAVTEGDVICELAVEARQAMLDQAAARMKQAKLEFDAARKLSSQGYRSETQAVAALASYEAAQAEVRRM